ncbi:MAG: hypothetical protein SGILL_009772 [Bacillariaceae sp.]
MVSTRKARRSPTLILCFLLGKAFADNEMALWKRLHSDYPEWIPRGVVDVGANQGGWTDAFLMVDADVRPKIAMFEATAKHVPKLEAIKQKYPGSVDYQIRVLADEARKITFYEGSTHPGGTGNSIFRENTQFFESDEGVTRQAIPLDEALEDSYILNDTPIDFLKLDVQGAERMILEGAAHTLRQISFLQLELSVVEYNSGGVCYSDIDEFLQKRGFRLYDIGEIIRSSGAFGTAGVGQYDVLYLREDSQFLPEQLKQAKFCRPGLADNQFQSESKPQPKATQPPYVMSESTTLPPTIWLGSGSMETLIAFILGCIMGMGIRQRTQLSFSLRKRTL